MRRNTLRPVARLCPVVFVPGALLAVLAACGSFSSASSSGNAGAEGLAGAAGAPGGSAGAAGGISMVSCQGDTCRVTLGGTSSTAQVLGTTFSIRSIDGGRVTLHAGDQDVTCAAGETVAAGALRIECTEVTAGMVRFTVTRA